MLEQPCSSKTFTIDMNEHLAKKKEQSFNLESSFQSRSSLSGSLVFAETPPTKGPCSLGPELKEIKRMEDKNNETQTLTAEHIGHLEVH